VIGRGAGGRLPFAAIAALLAVALLAGCSPYSGTMAQKVRQWASQNSFVANHDLLVTDINSVFKAVKLGTAKDVRTICGGTASDVGTAYVTLPTPNQALTNALNAADQTFVNAATSCSGISSLASPTMTRDLAGFQAGVADLRWAQRLLASFGVPWKIPPVVASS